MNTTSFTAFWENFTISMGLISNPDSTLFIPKMISHYF